MEEAEHFQTFHKSSYNRTKFSLLPNICKMFGNKMKSMCTLPGNILCSQMFLQTFYKHLKAFLFPVGSYVQCMSYIKRYSDIINAETILGAISLKRLQ